MRIVLEPPAWPLSDDTITLRLARTEDVAALGHYLAEPDGLDGIWMPVPQGASRERLVAIIEQWRCAWDGRESDDGPALLLEVAGASRFVGCIGFRERNERTIELTYGFAPGYRGRGLATGAARVATGWLIGERAVEAVELRIGREHRASRRVAEKVGFRLIGTVRQTVGAATYEDLRYRFTREDATQGAISRGRRGSAAERRNWRPRGPKHHARPPGRTD